MFGYNVALSYFLALTIVCVVLYSFTYFLPTPDNKNKAKSTFYFRLILLFTIAAFEAILLRYENLPIASIVLNNLFILMIAYNLMFAVYSRYDQTITRKHLTFFATHCTVFMIMVYLLHTSVDFGFLRSAIVLINVSIPYIFTLKKCNKQYKKHRLGDRVLYGALLATILIFIGYVVIYALVFPDHKSVPLSLYFITLLIFICVLFFGFALSIIYSLIGKLRKEIITDRLTGAKNRNYLNDVARQLVASAKRNSTPLSLVLCDIDWFKKINDTYGHATGDQVLKEFTHIITDTLRAEDVLLRIGGEEFVILLPHNDLHQAAQTAERLRAIINKTIIDPGENHINISACFGVTQVNLDIDIDKNINNADIALYEAKRNGRNKVISFGD